MPNWDLLWTDVNLATQRKPGDGGPPNILDGALGIQGDRIVWVGPGRALPGEPAALAREVRSGAGAWMTPGLIDCHTHLVFGGDRADEFERRLEGATYQEIARAGGGIRSTVRATRAATEAALAASAAHRLGRLVAEGVTTVEVKSGYGLDTETELRMLRAARAAGAGLAVDVRTTFLGAHAVPPEHDGRPEAYLDLVVEEMLPRVVEEGLASQADAFMESIAFTADQVERVLRAAADAGLGLRLHADQLRDGGGASLAASLGARSADHLEHTSEGGAEAMARAGTAAVLLPGAFYFLRETTSPPIESFRRHGVAMAVATDANPGSSPALSLLLMLNMACTLFRLTPDEALAGVTRVAAEVLDLGEDRGTLEVGKRADLALWDVAHPRELCYWIGGNPLRAGIKDGRVVREARPLG